MKLMTAYSVALYTAQNCILFDRSNVNEIVDPRPQDQGLTPDSTQLDVIQKNISINRPPFNNDTANNGFVNNNSNIVIVVPDNWISVSHHRVDHILPDALAPLAALSYAVETTFSAPDSLMYHYQQMELEEKQTQLTVFACSSEWATQLCSPFQALGASCLLMSQTQWSDLTVSNPSWSSIRKHALSMYQPDIEKNKRVKRRCVFLLLFSLILHTGAYLYLLVLQQQTQAVIEARQQTLALKSDWESDQKSTPFLESILVIVQALPNSIRLVQFDVGFDYAVLQVTLSQLDFASLIDRWRQDHSSWRFEWEHVSYVQPIGMNDEEVMDVAISIFEN